MGDPTAFALSKMLTQLTGRSVGFTLVLKAPAPKTKPLYGTYALLPGDGALVVRTELGLIGSFGAALLGLPGESVLERIKETPLDEVLGDAMHEVLNVASTTISVDHRAVFKKMHTDPITMDEQAGAVLRQPVHTTQFEVSIEGYTGGGFAILI